MTPNEQLQYWLTFHRFQQRQEKIYTPKFNVALRTQIKQYIDNGTVMAVNLTPIYRVIKDLYETVSPIWAAVSTRETRQQKYRHPMGFSQRIVDLMFQYYNTDLLSTSEGITQTTIDTIQAVLTESATTGAGFDEIVSRLISPDMTAQRARLIARTETVAASNAASNIAALDTGLLLDKIWISAKDNRTRPHHREVDGHIVGMNDKFIVGGQEMSFPGDKAGGASNVCNCRCTHAFIPKRDKQDRLLHSRTAGALS